MDSNTGLALNTLPQMIVAVGALGTAAFGLVDGLKALPGGGISRSGFKFIRETIESLLPPDAEDAGEIGLSRKGILHTLTSQWINGVDRDDQVSIAKSLVKLRLTPEAAPTLAKATDVDPAILGQVATSIQNGTELTQEQSDLYGRFDVVLTALLDQAYQRADQRYRNAAKLTAIPVAVILAIVGAQLFPAAHVNPAEATLIGLIATPIAPIAKDLSSALTTAVQAIQTWKK